MASLSSWRVLIVEDEIDAQDVMILLLQQHNMAILTAESGEEGLKKLRSEHPTLAIIDLALPGIDGWKVLEEMRADPDLTNIPAVAVTAYHSTAVAQEAIRVGFAAYFSKPINSRTFVADLQSVVAKQSSTSMTSRN